MTQGQIARLSAPARASAEINAEAACFALCRIGRVDAAGRTLTEIQEAEAAAAEGGA